MTPAEIITAARQSTNNESSTYFSDSELYTYLEFGIKEASTQCLVIETTDTTLVSVADQADYTLPTNIFSIKRVTYDGVKLRPSTLTELDKLTSAIQNTDSTGTPRFYNHWGTTLTLTPTPDTSALEIKLWAYKTQPTIDSMTTLSAPAELHHYFIDYVVYRMYLKEGDASRSSSHAQLWADHKRYMRQYMQERKRRDGFNIVQNEDQSISNILGKV